MSHGIPPARGPRLEWLNKFQEAINELAGNEFLQFTAEVWKPGEEARGKIGGKVSTSNKNEFPFLDMEMWWGEDKELVFGVYLKPNQQLKYLNDGSSHTPGCLKAIPNGVFHRLAKLTTISPDNENKKLGEIYPKHFEAMEHANLLEDVQIPTLKEKLEEIDQAKVDTESIRTKKRREKDRKRVTYFKIGFCTYWRIAISFLIAIAKQKAIAKL